MDKIFIVDFFESLFAITYLIKKTDQENIIQVKHEKSIIFPTNNIPFIIM